MLSRRQLYEIVAAILVMCGAAFAQMPDLYGDAISAYVGRDYQIAMQLLDELVRRDSQDPRVFFVRGVIAHAQGRLEDSKADFATGAKLEATGKSRVDVGKALERVQGPLRSVIEGTRRDAQRDAAHVGGPHLVEKTQKSDLARAIESYFDGDIGRAKKTLDDLVRQEFPDARVFYFRGLAHFQLGDLEAAKQDFEAGVDLEAEPGNQVDVDRALVRVQGAERAFLEEHRRETVALIREEAQAARKETIAAILEGRLNGATSIESGLSSLGKSNLDQPTMKPRSARRVSGADSKNRPTPRPVASKPPGEPAPAANVPVSVAYLPADSQLVVQVRVRELLASPLAAPLKLNPEFIKQSEFARTTIGVGPDDVESITAGVTIDFANLPKPGAPPGAPPVAPGAPGAPPAGVPGLPPGIPGGAQFGADAVNALKPGILVIRTRTAINADAIVSEGKHEKVDHQGKSFYRATDESMPSLYLPDPRTAVIGFEEALKKSIEQTEPSSELAQRFGGLSGGRHLVFAVIPSDPAFLNQPQPPNPFAPPAQQKLQKAIEGKVRGVALSLSLTANVEFESEVFLADSASATAAGPALSDLLKEAKSVVDLVTLGLNPKAGEGIREAYATIKGRARGDSILVSLSIKPASLTKIFEGLQAMGPPGGAIPAPPPPP